MCILVERAIATRPTHPLINTINAISLCSTRSRSLSTARAISSAGMRTALAWPEGFLHVECVRTGRSSNQNGVKPALMTSKSSTARPQSFWRIYGTQLMTTDISLQLTISDKSDKDLTSSWWPTIFFGHTRKVEAACLYFQTHRRARSTKRGAIPQLLLLGAEACG